MMMRNANSRLALAVVVTLAAGCPGDDGVAVSADGGDSTDTGMTTTITTTLPTTSIGTSTTPMTSSTTDVADSSSGDDTTTDDPDTTTGGTTGGTTGSTDSTGDSGSTGDTGSTGDSGSTGGTSGSTGMAGTSGSTGGSESSSGGMMNPEGFADCLDDDTVCIAGEQCLIDGPPATVSFCSFDACTDVSDCPSAPPGGNADVVCADITGRGIDDCYIDCQLGETCPTGMVCAAGACGWPVAPPDIGYEDCSADPTSCEVTDTCIVDDVMNATWGVCAENSCADVSDCPTAPPGGNAVETCGEITGAAPAECYLDCSGGETCPTGMNCEAGVICAWPAAPADVGYGDCLIDQSACLPSETGCLVDDIVAPTQAVCFNPDCADVSECPAAPPGGTAPPLCLDVTGDGDNDCVLDCLAGQTCPTGMTCLAGGGICIW